MGTAAFFDLDKTILSRSTALAFARPLYAARLIGRGDVVRSAYAQFTLVTGRVDHAAMERMRQALSTLVTGWDAERLRAIIAAQITDIVRPLIFAEAVELIEAHRRAGDQVVVVTSTGLDLAGPIGVLLGVDQVLGTRMVEVDGRYTGEIADYMYGPRKAAAITHWAEDAGCDLRQCAAYSDSITDLPMLLAVGRPHAVNPDRALRRLARQRGWPVHDFRASTRRRPPVIVTLVGAAIGALGLAALISWGIRRRFGSDSDRSRHHRARRAGVGRRDHEKSSAGSSRKIASITEFLLSTSLFKARSRV